jgi:hypothetical protein
LDRILKEKEGAEERENQETSAHVVAERRPNIKKK